MRGHGLTRLALKGPGRMPAQAIRFRFRFRMGIFSIAITHRSFDVS